VTNTSPERLTLDALATPIGEALLAVDEAGRLRALYFADFEPRMRRTIRRLYGQLEPQPGRAPAAIRQALDAYFSGELSALSAIAWGLAGTAFQQKAWTALAEIPTGETRSYGEQAARIGHPTAVRAVGLANGANPISLVLPCHRVIGANGPDRLWRRPGAQALAARARGRARLRTTPAPSRLSGAGPPERGSRGFGLQIT
jgi:methylated-DNA-[protein]-cysteine S-methyltransferase